MESLSSLKQRAVFRESWRGYDPKQVDDYVDQVTLALDWAQQRIHQLQQQLASAHEISHTHEISHAADQMQSDSSNGFEFSEAQEAVNEAIAESTSERDVSRNATSAGQAVEQHELDAEVEAPFISQLRRAASRDNLAMNNDDALSAFLNQDDRRGSPWFTGGR